jgi:hypothetical protein
MILNSEILTTIMAREEDVEARRSKVCGLAIARLSAGVTVVMEFELPTEWRNTTRILQDVRKL